MQTDNGPEFAGRTHTAVGSEEPKNGVELRFIRKPSMNHALARGVGTDVRRAVYSAPSSMLQGSSAS